VAAFYGSFNYPDSLADSTDYSTYTGGAAPANVDVLLRSATALVLEATAQAYYAVDPDTGDALDSQIADALTRATVIQAAAWSAMGYDPLTGGVVGTTVVQSTKAGGTSDTFADAQFAAQAKSDAVRNLVPDAVRVLQYNNLLIPNPWVFG
jgi:hypothetical protein